MSTKSQPNLGQAEGFRERLDWFLRSGEVFTAKVTVKVMIDPHQSIISESTLGRLRRNELVSQEKLQELRKALPGFIKGRGDTVAEDYAEAVAEYLCFGGERPPPRRDWRTRRTEWLEMKKASVEPEGTTEAVASQVSLQTVKVPVRIDLSRGVILQSRGIPAEDHRRNQLLWDERDRDYRQSIQRAQEEARRNREESWRRVSEEMESHDRDQANLVIERLIRILRKRDIMSEFIEIIEAHDDLDAGYCAALKLLDDSERNPLLRISLSALPRLTTRLLKEDSTK